jgi:hypothetical protein
MVREMVSIKSKSGIRREEFVKKYEEELAPLILKLCPGIRKYVRNYVRTSLTAPDPNSLPFDCITTEAFKSLAQFAMSEKGKAIFDLEADFMDTSKTVAVLVKKVN